MVNLEAAPPVNPASSVAVAVITYRRPLLLAGLLASLQSQQLDSGYRCRIVVVDNDAKESARGVVESIEGRYETVYAVEPEPGIPAARQCSVELTHGDEMVVFVDDDECAPPGWLARLLATQASTGADVVTGPVVGILPHEAPSWAHHSDVYTSLGKHRTGDHLTKAYTNNTLVTRRVLDTVTPAFHNAFRFTGSSDLHFFLRVARAGFEIVWDDEAPVSETVPPERLTLGWLARRAFRSGAGDAISRRLIAPGWRTVALCLALGAARMANGLGLLLVGVVSPRHRIKGLRRVVSGAGTLAGTVGINHDEYRRSPAG